MSRAPLIPPGAAEMAALRHWLAQDADHAAAAVAYGVYSLKDGLHFVITFGLSYAERAKIPDDLARHVAVALFHETLADHEARLNALKWRIVDAARAVLSDDPDDLDGAAAAASALAKEHHAPQGMVAFGLRYAAKAA